MKTYNISPYFDDFSDSNNYQQIMFKPGYAVQARELTQLQTILRDQIEKFGNHVFKHGSVVIPGNSLSDLAVPFIKVNSQYNSANITLANYENKVVVGVTSGVKAVVKKAVAASGTDPIVFYLSYISGGNNGAVLFQAGEDVYVQENPTIKAVILSSNATGVGSLAYVNRGVYYINGTFVGVESQSVVMSKFTSTPSCHVLFKITEEFVDSVTDTNLLDNAQGSYNYAAPGADRLKISLELVTLPLGSQITSDYVEIMRYNAGVLEEHSKNAKYSELEKSLARRTYDESGNYVVTGLVPEIREHLRQDTNGGVFNAPTGNIGKLVVDVSAGKAYIDGFEIEKIANTRLIIDKARTAAHIKNTNVSLRPEYGQYIIVSDLVGGTAGFTKTTIELYNTSDSSSTNAVLLGTATVAGVDYLNVGQFQPNVYKLWINNLSLNGQYTLDDVGGIRHVDGTAYANVLNEYSLSSASGAFSIGELVTTSSGRTATVKYYNQQKSLLYVYKHSYSVAAPNIGDVITGTTSSISATITARKNIVSIGQSGLLFKLPKQIPSSIKDPNTNSYNLRYVVQKQLSMTVSSGIGSVSITSGSLDAIEEGTFVAIGPEGPIDNSYFSILGNSIVANNCPQNGTVKIYANVTKEDVAPKLKTKATQTDTIATSNDTTDITLTKADVISLVYVLDNNSNDITANYTLFNGQTDYEYGYGVLRLKPGRPAPTGNVTVQYKYYNHSGAGDFFCVDSYANVSGFLDTIVVHKSYTSGVDYDLANCLDFRTLVNGNADVIVSGTAFISPLQYYVPRIDSLVVDSSGKISIISGIPDELPAIPTIPAGKFELNRMVIPAYTRNSTEVFNQRLGVNRYTMKDISGIVDRVEKVEDFATITASEILATKYNVKDAATGLDRFKTGYVVENFKQPLTLAKTTDNDFRATFVGDTLQAPHEPLNCKLQLQDSSTNYVIKNGYLMLPYTETTFASQPLSSRVTNLNPFLLISWNGIVDVNPPIDTWVETLDLPKIYEQLTQEVTVYQYIDPPPPPTYKIVPNYTILAEGQTVTFTVTTTQLANGTKLYYTIHGDVSSNDFTDGALSGNFTVTNNAATFTKTFTEDAATEGDEYFKVQLRTESTSTPNVAGDVVACTPEIKILDTSIIGVPSPAYANVTFDTVYTSREPQIPVYLPNVPIFTTNSYRITPVKAAAAESEPVTFQVVTTGVDDGTVLYWGTESITGTVNSADFTDTTLTGSVTIKNNRGSIIRTLSADATTESVAESFRLKLYNDSGRTTLLATSSNVSISDVSTTISYSITPSTVSLNEGETVTFNIAANGVAGGTTLYYKMVQTTSPQSLLNQLTSDDFTDGALTGSVTVSSQAATFSKTLANDFTTEGTEYIEARLYTDAACTVLVAVSKSIAIADTSVTTYSVTPSVTSVSEGSSVTFSIATQGVKTGSTLYYSIASANNAVTASDFADGTSTGSFVISNGTGSVVKTLANDLTTEGNETMYMNLYTDSARTTPVASSQSVSIIDSSTNTYKITPSSTVVNEGSSIAFTVDTTGVGTGTKLYWSINSVSGTTNASDFTDGALTGTVTISNNTASFTKTISNDLVTDGQDVFEVKLYSDSGRTDLVTVSPTVTILDTSINTYKIDPSAVTVNEGSTLTFTVTTTGVTDGTTLYWGTNSVSGTVNAADFSDSTLTGSVTINSNTGIITRTINNDLITEGVEKFEIGIYSDSGRTVLLANSATIAILDTSINTYRVEPSVAAVSEGGSVTFNVTTTGVANGTTLYWGTESISGTVNAADFSDSTLTGTVSITGNSGSITRTLASDLTTEGDEIFEIKLYSDSGRTTLVTTSSSVKIQDTSINTYKVEPSVTSVAEGGSVTFNVTTTGVTNGTTLYWGINSITGTVNAADFSDSLLTGSVTVSSGTASFSKTISADASTEGTERFEVKLYTDSGRTALVATSASVTIQDTSITISYGITPSVASVNEGSSVTFSVVTTGVADGTTLYWGTTSVVGTVNSSDFTDATLTGSVTISSNAATITRTMSSDLVSEGDEQFRLNLYTDSGRTALVTSSSTVTIKDTSVNTYSVTPNITAVNEGSSVTFSVVTTGVANNTVLYWGTTSVSGTVNSSDFTDATLTGSVTIQNNAGTITRTLSNDLVSEGDEQFRLNLYTDSGRTTLVTSSSTIAIKDTSVNTYSVTPNITAVSEGGTVTFTVATTGVANGTTLYWGTGSVVGTINSSDFTDATLTGSVTIQNNAATISRALSSDFTSEGDEQFRIQLYSDSGRTTLLTSSQTVTVYDVSVNTYRIQTIGAGSWNEGSPIGFTVTTTGVANGTTLYWGTESISGTINSSDFSDSTLTGTVTINNNTGSITRTLSSDNTTEGMEQFRLNLYSDSSRTVLVAKSNSVAIDDTSIQLSYAITSNKTSVNEGESVTFTVSTTGVPTGTWLYWRTIPLTVATGGDGALGINSGDFVQTGSSSYKYGMVGMVQVNSGTGSFNIQMVNDFIKEGTEQFIVKLYSDLPATRELASSASVSILDTSTYQFTITPTQTTWNEGSIVRFNIASSINVTTDTKLYYKAVDPTGKYSGTNDIWWHVIEGAIGQDIKYATIPAGSKTSWVHLHPKKDERTEGTETVRVELYLDLALTQLAAVSDMVSILDTSVGALPVVYDPDPPPQPPVVVSQPVVTTKTEWVTVDTSYGGLYGSILGRAGETSGVNFWATAAQNGVTTTGLINGFVTSPEYQSLGSPVSLDKVDTSAITSTTVKQVQVTSTYVNGVLTSTANGATKTTTTGVDIYGNAFTTTK